MRESETRSNRYYQESLRTPLHSFWLRHVMDRSSAQIARAMLAAGEFEPADRVVDVGPGLGGFMITLFESGLLHAPPIGVELSDEMADRLESRLERKGETGIRVIRGSGVDLAVLVNAATVVVSHGMVKHLDDDDLASFFAAVHQTLRPGGRFFVGEVAAGRGPFARYVERAMGQGSVLRSEDELVTALVVAGFDSIEATTFARSKLPARLAWLRARKPEVGANAIEV
jgi:cyclopropane fatty-acyl-phospholipid synthase-like methyltransferase